MLLTLFVIPVVTLFLFVCIWNFDIFKINFWSLSAIFQQKLLSRFELIKLLTLSSLYINLLYGAYLWKFFPKFTSAGVLYPSAISVGGITLFEVQQNLNLPFILLSIFILIVSLLTVWYSQVHVVLTCGIFLLLEIFLVGAFTCTSIFAFLLFFEASALPIFILISYCGSSRRERIKASFYFLFFTLYGSISLLLLLLNFYSLSQLGFMVADENLITSSRTLWLLLFIAFAVKIPLFPFHIWLPYAHVEASTSTSIILAALMLKLGGYGVLKFMLPLFFIDTHLFFKPFALSICIIGTIYGGLCALRQIDLKRQIAFSSISHMSFATIGIFSLTEVGIKGSVYLMLSHGLTSAALFFLVGVLSDRYHTRSIAAFSGLMGSMPIFSSFLIFMSLANVGFPGTSGFLPELAILVALVSSYPLSFFLVLVGMFLTTASSLILLLRILFGHIKEFSSKSAWVDISWLEFCILIILSIWVLILGCWDILACV